MLTEELLSQQAGAESAHTSLIHQQMLDGLKSSKAYRHSFVEEIIQSRLTAQIYALRQEYGWDLKTFAERLGKKLSWAYRLEDPNVSVPTIPTLLEVAQAFDIGLDVRFRRFSELLDDSVNLTPESFLVPSFETELKSGAFRVKPLKRRSRSSNAVKGPIQTPKLVLIGKRSVKRKRRGSQEWEGASAMSSQVNLEYLKAEHGTRKVG